MKLKKKSRLVSRGDGEDVGGNNMARLQKKDHVRKIITLLSAQISLGI
jgi:hypothetical protein